MKAESLGNAYLFPNSGGVDRILLSKCHFVPPRRRTSCLDTSVIDCWLQERSELKNKDEDKKNYYIIIGGLNNLKEIVVNFIHIYVDIKSLSFDQSFWSDHAMSIRQIVIRDSRWNIARWSTNNSTFFDLWKRCWMYKSW